MNYPLRDTIIGLLMNTLSADEFSEKINHQLNRYDRENLYAMYNPLGSHDTVRIKTEFQGNSNKVKMAFIFQMAFPGAPAIYYGDEIGMEGDKDPDCRRAFPWDADQSDPGQWDQDLWHLIRQLITLRKNRGSLRRGSYEEILVDGKTNGYAFARRLGDEGILIFLNASSTRRNFRLSVDKLDWQDGRIVRDLISNQEYIVSGPELVLDAEPWRGYWIA